MPSVSLVLCSLLGSVILISTGAMAAPTASKAAEPATVSANQALLTSLPFSDTQAFEDARRGFIAALPDAMVRNEDGTPAWSMQPYAFLDEERAPDTVNPSLWRQARLNAIHGLFKVTEGIYQVRGMDLANMTIVEGETGLIIIDPLLTPATARAALDLYLANRPHKPVVAVIYSHSHIDHFGGVKGVINAEDVAAGKARVYAPAGFMQHAVSENVIAGNAMSRRALYMYGLLLPPGERGHVDTGLGKTLGHGTHTLIPPTDSIGENGVQRIDGVDIEFHMAQGSEAPSEFMMYFPARRVLNTAEVTSQHMHNIYTIRGAEVRDAARWSRYIDEVRESFGERTEVLIGQHHWPLWNGEDARHFLGVQRDLYKFIHDQSVRLMNHGYRPGEIAETIQLPASLANEWSVRGYYGTLRHNARAIYQKYLGWYDANPANLNPPTPQETARKTIEYMGGMQQVLERARADFARGEYRWVASVMNQAVFAEPDNREARELQADALEQLGYQAESGPWRGAYLTGAQELRQGTPELGASALGDDLLQALDTGMFFDLLGVRLNGPKAEGKHIILNWRFTDSGETYRVNLQNSTLTWLPDHQAEDANATLSLTRATLNEILLKRSSFPKAVLLGDIKVDGNPLKLFEFLLLMDEFTADFPLIEPLKES
jgi:alkyl sulfatase BDS1-like metallo-beta-lactamase superfamily hydrolase